MEANRLSHSVWREIREVVNKAKPRSEVTYDVVTKRDEKNRLIWTKDFGDTPIPLVGFRWKIKYYDSETKGNTPSIGAALPSKVLPREVYAQVEVPRVGDTVVILRQLGVKRLPKAVGIILSTNFVESD